MKQFSCLRETMTGNTQAQDFLIYQNFLNGYWGKKGRRTTYSYRSANLRNCTQNLKYLF